MEQKLYDLMDWAEIETIVYSEHDHPERILGAHKVRGGILVQAFLPDAKAVFIKRQKDGKLYQMEEADEAGFFAALLLGRKEQPYDIVAKYKDGTEVIKKDSYSYPCFIPEEEQKRFMEGKSCEIYRYLGAHPVVVKGDGEEAVVTWGRKASAKSDAHTVCGTHFAVYAPKAVRVSVVGDFNKWDGRTHQMCQWGDCGLFSLFVPDVDCGELYKYEIKRNVRTVELLTDPYGFRCEVRPKDAGIVTDLSGFEWNDSAWMEKRAATDFRKEAVSVYEVHLGSWMHGDKTEKNAEFLNYREIAPKLAAYVKKMGYTHIELLPVMEHLSDESWGYQVTGYYAVTSRYGTPKDFQYFMNYMHQEEIGVILDWGELQYAGSALKEENFLISNFLFWKDIYHADGIKIKIAGSMFYLDYGRQNGEWSPNENGGNENLYAVSFLKRLSQAFHEKKDGALLIAETAVAWPRVTGAAEEDGLGFDLKWNTGWMNDYLSYMRLDPYFRKGSHNKLVLSMIYAYSENFMLPFPHDVVTEDKGSLLMQMTGETELKFGNLKTAFGFMMMHTGKKLHFMGQEFAQTEGWNGIEPLHWEEEQEKTHQMFQRYVKELNQFYRNHPALYESDYDEEGFEWISCLDADHSIIAFMRRDSERKEQLLVICNFTPVLYENFKVGVPFEGKFKEIFNSDKAGYGGTGCLNERQLQSKEVFWDGRTHSITLNMPPFGICVFQCIPKRE